MARTSSLTARAGGARTLRRSKVMPESVGAAEPEDRPDAEGGGAAEGSAGAAGPENRPHRTSTTYSEDPANAADLPGADAPPKSSETSANRCPPALRLWLARARSLGLTAPQLVFELHVRRGVPLLDVARVLELGLEEVREHWLQIRAARAALAPQSESDFAALREHISAALWQTVEATFPDVMQDAEEGEDADPPGPSSPPMLSVRLKALDQIAKLYDLTLEIRSADFAPLPYATPEDIALSVRERVLEMHQRGE